MLPSAYPYIYLGLPVWLENAFTMVSIRNYLKFETGEQYTRAQAAKSLLLSKIAGELKFKSGIPKLFQLGPYTFQTLAISRVFMGKGAPDEIQDVLWLASLFGIVNVFSVQTYCDRNIGMDCGGFVACLWGIGRPENGNNPTGSTGFKPRYFWDDNKTKQRAKASDIQAGDAVIFFANVKNDNPDQGDNSPALGSQAHHIGAVGGIQINSNNTIDLLLMESSGAKTDWGGNGVTERLVKNLPLKTAKGLVYVTAGKDRLYFVGKTVNVLPYIPYGGGDY